MNSDERLDRVVEIEKQFSALHAEQARLIAAIADDPCGDAPVPMLDKEYFREELRVRLGEAALVINDRIETSRTLVHQLPATLAALEAGELTMRHARALCSAVVGLSVGDAALIEQACVPFAVGRDYTAFTRKIRREVLALGSAAQQERSAAAVADRRVWCSPNLDAATATVGAVLPADGAQLVMAAVEQAADNCPKDDSRTRDQRRADGLIRIVTDWLNGSACADATTELTANRIGPAVQVTVAASTLLGLDDQPGELAGHGPIPAAMARAIAADPNGTWRRLVTDQTGRLVDYGRTRYRPPAMLRDFVIARDRECQFPGCHRGARFCELDHLVAWADGGTTSAQNLICLCTRHHHLKHETDWTLTRLANGDLRWTGPDGRTYENEPGVYPVDTTGTSEPARTAIVVSDDNCDGEPCGSALVA